MTDQSVFIQQGVWARLGLPRELCWGFIGVFLFITGATIEQSWLASLLQNRGFAAVDISVLSSVSASAWRRCRGFPASARACSACGG